MNSRTRVAAQVVASALLMVAALVAPAAAAAPPDSAATDTLRHVVTLPEVVVSTARAGERAPIARSVLTRDALRDLNRGEDTPMVLSTLPGAYAYSDAGNGIGYSYLSIRGFPQRRISVTVNGVPLNDPESHEVYWIDHPDLLASTSAAEVQRGVGSALYGAASLGGAVNLETGPMDALPHTSALLAYGSYDTKRLMLEMGSGALQGGWNVYGRYSRIESQGYRDQSFTRLWSYAFSARHESGRQSLRVNLYGGPEETHLAYLGVPADYMDGAVTGNADRDRRFNPLTYPNERDHFFEPHYELIHTWSPSEHFALTQTLFWFDGRGFYDEQRFGQNLSDYRLSPWLTADSTLAPRDYYQQDGTGALTQDGSGRFTVERFDVVRRRTVVDRHFGWVPRAKFTHARGALIVGGELRAHDGRHFGEVLSGSALPPGTAPDVQYYDYHPRTLAAGLFAREEYSLAPALLATADLGWRHEGYAMRDDHFDGIRFDQTYDFANPRVGFTWTPRASTSVFASWALSAREPAFRDLYDAEGLGSVPLYRIADVVNNVYQDPLIKPEHVSDVELGASWKRETVEAGVNLFRMDFRDELVYAGQFNTDLGYSIIGNAARSVHQGVELTGRAARAMRGGLSLGFEGNATLSDNHFVRYREVDGPTPADVVSFDGKALGFFPAVLANVTARAAWRSASVHADVRHAGRVYVDNTESILASVGPHTTLDLGAAWRRPIGGNTLALTFDVLNALDTRYATSGYMDYDATGALVPQFMPAATRHVLGQVRVDF
ncbi:MAG TPA: TonB-dependent receptor [Candidatus Saccharimonadaceae bacterium]|jgi:iron complex outermembrane receptor protein|nr:TonB-dependent receptor [Candidatus Saccharimonadaceae bacterium]